MNKKMESEYAKSEISRFIRLFKIKYLAKSLSDLLIVVK